MISRAPTMFTPAEYLALERASDRKHELVDGVIVAMAGGRPAHNMLAVNTAAALLRVMRSRGCATMNSDQRVHFPVTGLYTYPDVVVACGPRRYDDADPPSLLNPSLLVEVTSDTTEDLDRGKKFLHYQSISDLKDYVIVSHRERRVDHYRRQGDGQWTLTTHTTDEGRVRLSASSGVLSVREIYAGVDLTEGAKPKRTPRAPRARRRRTSPE